MKTVNNSRNQRVALLKSLFCFLADSFKNFLNSIWAGPRLCQALSHSQVRRFISLLRLEMELIKGKPGWQRVLAKLYLKIYFQLEKVSYLGLRDSLNPTLDEKFINQLECPRYFAQLDKIFDLHRDPLIA